MLDFFSSNIGPWAGQAVAWALLAAIPAIGAPISAFVFRKLQQVGINIDAAHRDSYTAAGERAAGNLVHMVLAGTVNQQQLADHAMGGLMPPEVQKLVKDVRAAAPDALRHFRINNINDATDNTIASKIIGLAGTLPALANLANLPVPFAGAR